jgi:integrase/recombinase XerD
MVALHHPAQALVAFLAVRLSCERNAVAGNPVDGVKRPMSNGDEGSTPALGDEQERRLLSAPAPDTLKGARDRAILATLLYHGIRREELCKLCLRDIQTRRSVVHFRIQGKRDKIRFVAVHPTAQRLIAEYLAMANQGKQGGRHEPDWNQCRGKRALRALHAGDRRDQRPDP